MLKALLKKQMLETAAFFFFDPKRGKRRSPAAILGFAALMVYAFGVVAFMFWGLSDLLCAPLVESGLDWVYFAFFGVMAAAFGLIGSIFTVKNRLYEGKDNEMLLAMPLPTWMILFVRMLGLYAYTLFFEALVFLPAIVKYALVVGGFFPIVCGLLVLLIMPLGTLAIAGALGWLIALVSARLPMKNLFTALFSVAFMAAYFVAYSRINTYLNYVLANGAALGEKIKTVLYPFWKMGLAAAGDGAALLLYALMFAGAFALVYLLIAKTFLRFVTMKRGERKAKYKATRHKQKSVFGVLLRKEGLRLFKNPLLAMNTLMGSLLFIVLPVFILAEGGLVEMIKHVNAEEKQLIGLIFTAALCAIASMNIVTGSSVSLEGESLWLLQAAPIATKTILSAKLIFQFIATMVPAFLSAIVLSVVFGFGAGTFLSAICTTAAFTLLMAAIGLIINLKMPNLHWTNEVVVVKQSFSTLLAMFAGLGVIAISVGGYFLFGKYLPPWGFGLLCIALFSAAFVGAWLWLRERGARIFERL